MKHIDSSPVRTRMAPSPTGLMHVGSLATLLKNYAFAKKNHGQFILRIEDTDKTREVTGGVDSIKNIIRDYGLDWDEGPDKDGPFAPYLQSQRLHIYQTHAQELLKEQKAYYCFCSKERLENLRKTQQDQKIPTRYDRACLKLGQEEIDSKIKAGVPYVIRLKVPNNVTITFDDILRGKISFNSSQVDDQVLLKSDGFPTYHLAVVVDDHLMKITHIIRGEEWISSAPKHVLLYQAFGWKLPTFCHVPVFLNPDGKGKMSKRKGTVSAQSFLDQGYLKEAMLNFLMILGWTPHDQRDIVSLDEYIREFEIKDLHPNSVVFDLKKLDWLNGKYLRNLPQAELLKKLKQFLPKDLPKEKLLPIVELVKDRMVKLSDIIPLTDFFYRQPTLSANLLCKNSTTQEVQQELSITLRKLELTSWQTKEIEQTVRDIQIEHNWPKKQFFMLLRLTVTGKTATPPLFETIELIGKQETCQRINQALLAINENTA